VPGIAAVEQERCRLIRIGPIDRMAPAAPGIETQPLNNVAGVIGNDMVAPLAIGMDIIRHGYVVLHFDDGDQSDIEMDVIILNLGWSAFAIFLLFPRFFSLIQLH
jgi:hypothetical protein